MAADAVRRFGVEPKVALLSHSNFGSSEAPSALKMRNALALLRERAPELEVDGEMHGDSALDESLRKTILLESCSAPRTCWSARTSTLRTSPTTCSRLRPAET
jgi:malate dehydrogenase (oxaloacetate-decarboxylating)(NADP+)